MKIIYNKDVTLEIRISGRNCQDCFFIKSCIEENGQADQFEAKNNLEPCFKTGSYYKEITEPDEE
jgi:hypothetical protein